MYNSVSDLPLHDMTLAEACSFLFVLWLILGLVIAFIIYKVYRWYDRRYYRRDRVFAGVTDLLYLCEREISLVFLVHRFDITKKELIDWYDALSSLVLEHNEGCAWYNTDSHVESLDEVLRVCFPEGRK